MKVTKTKLTNKVVLGSVISKKQRKGLRIVLGIELLTTFTGEKMVHLSIKLNKAIEMIVDLLPLSANHYQRVDKPTFGAINAFPLSQRWSDQLEKAVNLGLTLLPIFLFSFLHVELAKEPLVRRTSGK